MKLKIKEVAIFAIFGTLMYISKVVTEILPNIHIIGVLIGYVILKFYNGKLGKKIKFLYWFYPVHMLIIYFIYLIVNGGYLIGM